MFCLYMPTTRRALLVVVQPASAAVREVSVALLERAWREAVHAAAAAAAAGEPVGPVPAQVGVGGVGAGRCFWCVYVVCVLQVVVTQVLHMCASGGSHSGAAHVCFRW